MGPQQMKTETANAFSCESIMLWKGSSERSTCNGSYAGPTAKMNPPLCAGLGCKNVQPTEHLVFSHCGIGRHMSSKRGRLQKSQATQQNWETGKNGHLSDVCFCFPFIRRRLLCLRTAVQDLLLSNGSVCHQASKLLV